MTLRAGISVMEEVFFLPVEGAIDWFFPPYFLPFLFIFFINYFNGNKGNIL